MRKLLVRSIIPIMLLIFLSFSVYSQINCVPVFTAEYKSSGGIEPYDIKELSDGNFIVAGRGKTLPNTLYHGMVTKINTTGDVLWSFLLDGSSETGLQAITLLSNGDYLLHGIIYETGYPEGKPLVIRIASNGTIIWSRMIAANGIGKDRIKSMQELPGGDFIGTMNQNDSSAQSDPIVFRMTNTGTLQWTHRFDHGGDDSFTSIAFDGGIVYAAGFYSTTFKRGVIVKLTENGDFISAVTQSVRNDMDEEVVSIEVNNNIISFGVRATTADFCNVSFVQKDMQGKKLFQRLSALGDDVTFMKVTRTPDQGFMVLRSYSTVNPVEVTKISRYGASQWGAAVSFNGIQQNYAMDFTSDGGVVTAGHYRDELSGTMLMRATKTDKAGFGGDCVKRGGGVFTDTVTVFESGFDWKEKNLTDDLLINPAAVSRDNFTLNKDEKCKESVCVDGTPLPPGCGKTYRIEYGSDKSMYFRDVISAPDGGKLAVGSIFATEIAEDGLVVKLNMNGDVAWSRSYEEFFHNMYLTRILRSADNNYFIFANNKYIFSNWIYHSLAIIKINDQGNVL